MILIIKLNYYFNLFFYLNKFFIFYYIYKNIINKKNKIVFELYY